MTTGPVKTTELSVLSTVSGQARIVAIATVGGSLQTVTIPLSAIQNNNIGPLDTLSDVSISGPTDGMGLTYSSSRAQWIATSVGNLKSSNNLSDVDAAQARANLDVMSSTSVNLFYLSINAVSNTQIQTLSNVSVSAATDFQVLAYNSAASEWRNRQLSTSDISGIGSYITSASVVTLIAPYLTSVSAVILIAPYITSASAVTLVANFITSASASTMVASQLVPYVTSASAETRLATKIGALSSASDVSISSASNAQILVYRTSDSKWHNEANTGAGIQGIVSASDVSVSSPSNGQILVYRTSDSKWHNEANTGSGITAIASASDVSVSSATTGQFLTFGADSKWHNTTQDIPTSASVSTMIVAQLGPYITSASAVTLVAPYLTSASLVTALGPYITSASAESRYAIASSVTQTLTTYLTSLSASAAYASVGIFNDKKVQNISDVSVSSLANGQFLVYRTSDSKWHNETFDYVTSTQVSAAIQNFITSASASTMVASQLVPYATSASVLTALGPYITSASVETRLAAFLSSASAVTMIAPYITSASVETRLATFVTSVSLLTALSPYITSASAENRLATKIGAIASASDVSVSSAANGQILVFRTSDSKWHNEAAAASGITAIASASDIALTSPVEGDILIYDASAAKFKNQAAPFFPSFIAKYTEEDFAGGTLGAYTLTTVTASVLNEGALSGIGELADPNYAGFEGIAVSTTNTYGKVEKTNIITNMNTISSTSRVGFLRSMSRVFITTLTNATSVNAQFFSGFADAAAGATTSLATAGGSPGSGSGGIGFLADGSKSTWQVVKVVAASVTTVDTSVTVSVNTWINLRTEICVAPTAASVQITHFINGVQVHQYTSLNGTAITGLAHTPLYLAKKTTGTNIGAYLDYAKCEFIFTSLGRGTF